MSNPQISVIIPVYNVEKYLERCVKSVTEQTFTDLEIILVDDGSTDGSGAMCDKLAKEDSRIRVIHKENGGQSDARNLALDNATGELICFVDSDDYIEPNHMAELYGLIGQYDADIAVGGIYNCYETYRTPQCKVQKEFCCKGEKALEKMLEGIEISGSPCCKLIRKKLVENRYFMVGKTYEDAFYLPELLLSADKIAVTTKPLYNYWHRSNSTTTEPFNNRAMDIIDAYQYTKEVIINKQLDLLEVASFRLYWAHFVVLDRILLLEDYRSVPQYKKVLSFLKNNWLNIVKCGYFQKSRRIAAIALKINVRLYRFISMLKSRKDGVNK